MYKTSFQSCFLVLYFPFYFFFNKEEQLYVFYNFDKEQSRTYDICKNTEDAPFHDASWEFYQFFNSRHFWLCAE